MEPSAESRAHGADVEQPGGAKADAGRRYRAYPTPAQAERLTEWSHTCRAVWNLALAQRDHLYRHRGYTLRAVEQGVQVTQARGDLPWLADLPAQSAQQVLRQLDRAYDNWWNPQHPAGPPTFRKRSTGLAVPFPGQAVKVRKLNRRWAQVRLPKVGWVRLRLSRPLGGAVRNATVRRDGLGWHVAFGVATGAEPAAPNGLPGCGVDFGVACSAWVSDESSPRLLPPTSPRESSGGCSGWHAARPAGSAGPSVTTAVGTPAGCAAPSPRSPCSGRGRRAGGWTSPTSSPPTWPRATAGSGSRTCGCRT
jgi:Helix-turn-helix domain